MWMGFSNLRIFQTQFQVEVFNETQTSISNWNGGLSFVNLATDGKLFRTEEKQLRTLQWGASGAGGGSIYVRRNRSAAQQVRRKCLENVWKLETCAQCGTLCVKNRHILQLEAFEIIQMLQKQACVAHIGLSFVDQSRLLDMGTSPNRVRSLVTSRSSRPWSESILRLSAIFVVSVLSSEAKFGKPLSGFRYKPTEKPLQARLRAWQIWNLAKFPGA